MLVKVALILQIFIYFAVAFHLSSQGEVVCLSQSSMAVSMQASSGTTESKKRVVICGATGYIGKYVVQESVRRGHDTIALVRPGSSTSGNNYLKGATIVYSDVADEQNLKDTVFKDKVDVVVSCLASRSGFKEDSYKIDYQATKNSLNAGIHGKADLFILLSAFCVRKPLLHFQKAKLKLEELLVDAQKTGKIPKYSIVRPTAFFKSVSGQFELLQQGWPFVMFGNGEIRKCNPIAESDLATYMLDCADKPERWNKVLNIGGPDEGMTMKKQGNMIFEVLGKKPRFWTVPLGVFDVINNFLAFLGRFFPQAEDAAELGRIGKYYAVEDMLTTEPSEKYGKITLRQHYERIKMEGQEYDHFTTVLGSKIDT